MVDARQEAIDELESFEKDYNDSFDDENFDNESVQSADLGVKSGQRPEPDEGESVEEEDTARDATGQESDSRSSDQSGKEPKPRMVTLPDDKEAFGKFAGKKISYEQLAEEGLVDNLVTWGHQGRHMVSRGQEELEEARKMRELMEKQVALAEQTAKQASAPPPATPEQNAASLVERYMPAMQKYAEAGGIEPTFLDNYPKAAAYIEDRFQAASQLGNILVSVIDELKQSVEPLAKKDTTQTSEGRLRSLSNEVAKSNEIFSFLGDDDGYREFMKWATADDSTLNWVDKSVSQVTAADIQASVLLYMHTHPEKFTKQKPKASEEERRLATGGTGRTKPAVARPTADEISTFMKEYGESFQGQDY